MGAGHVVAPLGQPLFSPRLLSLAPIGQLTTIYQAAEKMVQCKRTGSLRPRSAPSTIRREENKEASTSCCCRGNRPLADVDLPLSIKGGKPVRPSLSLSLQTSPCLRPRWEERREEIMYSISLFRSWGEKRDI
jgi:hypothetical protein